MPGLFAGDVQFKIKQKLYSLFQRKDDDLFFHDEIDVPTALTRGSIYIEHLADRRLTLNIELGKVIGPGKPLYPSNHTHMMADQ